MSVIQAKTEQAVYTRRIRLDELADLPTCTRNISHKLVGIISDRARQDASKMPLITVGEVKGTMYAVNDLETVLGLRRAKVKAVDALVGDYLTLEDLIVDHVHRNFHPHTIDPLKLHNVVEYLARSGVQRSSISKILWIDKRPELAATLQCSITDEARRILSEMMDTISKKVYSAVLPPYYITKLAKIADTEQVTAALQMQSITLSKMNSDSRSAWPTPEMIKTILQSMGKRTQNQTVEERISLSDGKSLDTRIVKKAKDFIGADPNLIYIPTAGKKPDLIVHKKTGRVSEAKNMQGVCSLVGDRGRPVFTLPKSMSEFLDVANEKVFFYKYDTMKKAQDALCWAKSTDTKCVIITSASL